MIERGWSARFVFSFSRCLCALLNLMFVFDDVDSCISRFDHIYSTDTLVLLRYFCVFDFDFGFAYNRSYGRCRF